MLYFHSINFERTGIFCYKALQNATILNLPLYNCKASLHKSRYLSSCNPCDSRTDKKKTSVVYKMFVPPGYKDHDYKNMALGRPMSPHLTIYAPTMSAMTSIVQRITGVTTAICALILTGGTLFLANGVETYVSMLQNLELSHTCALMVKLLLGWPFAFHYFNGIRFCAWNAGRMLAKETLSTSAKQAIVASIVGAILFAMF